MIRRLYLFLILSFAIVSSCGTKEKISVDDSRIIIVNIRNANRGLIASAINKLNDCDPSIIGLDFILSGNVLSPYDSSLINSIKDAGNVVALDAIEDQIRLQEDIGSSSYKVAYSTQYWNGDRFYCPLAVSENGKLFKSMGLVVASESSKSTIDFIKSGGNVTSPLEPDDLYKENYKVIDIDSVSSYCSLLTRKIVILGNMDEIIESKNSDKNFVQPYLTASTIVYIFDYKTEKTNSH